MARPTPIPSHALAQALDRHVTAATAQFGAPPAWVDLPLLMDEAMVLELTGEAMRQRLIFAEAGADYLVLRPDLTLPAVRAMVANPPSGPTLWLQSGVVFRRPSLDANSGAPSPMQRHRRPEHWHIGLESFGAPNPVAADVATFLAAHDGLADAGHTPQRATFCDAGLANFILANVSVPQPWDAILADSFGHGETALSPRLGQILAEASGRVAAPKLSAEEQAFVGLKGDALEAALAKHLAQTGQILGANRSIAAMAARLAQKIARASAPTLPASMAHAFSTLFAAEGPIEQALDQIYQAAKPLGVDASAWRHDWQQRIDAIAARTRLSLTFEAAHARDFGYYDGMMFDLYGGPVGPRPWASGGRYDGLVARLGGANLNAIGCVLRPETLGGQHG